MKTETKAIVASIAVIALLLTTLSGATYSWFSDTHESAVTVTTGKVEYAVVLSSDTAQVDTGKNTVAISDLAPGAFSTVKVKITNNSTIKTVYRICAEYTVGSENVYEYSNVYINDTKHFLSTGSTGEMTMVIKEWAELSPSKSPSDFDVKIAVSQFYGSNPDGTSHVTGSSPISFKIVVEAYQSDYPTDMMVCTSDELKNGVTVPKSGVIKGTFSIQYNNKDVDVPVIISGLEYGSVLKLELSCSSNTFTLTSKSTSEPSGYAFLEDINVFITLPYTEKMSADITEHKPGLTTETSPGIIGSNGTYAVYNVSFDTIKFKSYTEGGSGGNAN